MIHIIAGRSLENDVSFRLYRAINTLMEQMQSFEERVGEERPRLVRLCAGLTGNPAVSEDLAQEVLLEAWRARGQLHDPRGLSAWLSAIARHVCLRWRRAQFSATSRLPDFGTTLQLDEIEIDGGMDLELEVERHDLTDLLDRALGLLPAGARSVLTQRYAEDLPIREMAVRNGISEGAISLRLHRSTRALKRVLSTDLRPEASAFGLLGSTTVEWQETRIRCLFCGHGTLQVQRDPVVESLAARCTRCSVQWIDHNAHYLDKVKGPWRTMLRMSREANQYFRAALRDGRANCTCCGGHADVFLSPPPDVPGRGVQICCTHCGAISYQPSIGLIFTLPQTEAFWREHRRIYLLREYEIVRNWQPIVITTLQSMSSAATLDIVWDRTTFEVLEINSEPTKETIRHE
jgi:RNA polymerase sigma factor (sigma-70 family)